jgi:hypothetical protein
LRKQDGAEIEDDEVLDYLFKNETEVWLTAVPKKLETLTDKTVKVTTFNCNNPVLLSARNLLNLKENAEKEFKIKIKKFIRKSDGVEIDEDDILDELINSDKNLILIALQTDEEFGNKY